MPSKINAFFKWLNDNLMALGVIGSCITAIAATRHEIYAFFDPPKAELKISAEIKSVMLNNNIELNAVIHQVGGSEIPPGVVEFETDSAFLQRVSDAQVETKKFVGSTVASEKTQFKAIATSENPVRISARFTSGDVLADSNVIEIKIVEPPIEEVVPHLETSDTRRVNLTGTWQVEVGGHMGIMQLKQATDGTLRGSFDIPDSNWPKGTIKGFKDGVSIRIRFDIDNKKNERVRIAGDFDFHNGEGGYIEIRGCAYHLRKAANTRYTKTGNEGLKCVEPASYDTWTQVAPGADFYATAPFKAVLKSK